jgi:hypothetical protein
VTGSTLPPRKAACRVLTFARTVIKALGNIEVNDDKDMDMHLKKVFSA